MSSRIMTICTLNTYVKRYATSMPAQTAVATWEGPFTRPEERFIEVDIMDYFRQNIKQLTNNEVFDYTNSFIRQNPKDETFLDDLTALLKEIKPDYLPYVLKEIGRYNPKLSEQCLKLVA